MNETRTGSTKRTVAMRVLCGLIGAVFFVAAGMKFFAVPFETQNFAHFGYAPWFMYVTGVIELLGGVMLVWPRWSAFGALAMVPILIGAAASHLHAGDGIGMATPALVILALCLFVAFAKREDLRAVIPGSRDLQAA